MTPHRKEDWMNTKWRPAMGWMYMIVCITDFIIFPILWSMLQAMDKGSVTNQWQPLTLQGAGLFHMAMGAIVGVTAWSRGQEKLGGVVSGNSTNDILSSRSPTFGYQWRICS
jgi:Cu/Ag efflux pump CusA